MCKRFVITFRKNVLSPSLVQVDAEVIWNVSVMWEILRRFWPIRPTECGGYTAYTELLGIQFFKNPAFQDQLR
jgi:hypothetical protein